MLSVESLQSGPLVGNDAGWALAFYKEGDDWKVTDLVVTFSRNDYYADIQAKLPGDLTGGTYKFTIEGMTDEDYGKIAPFSQRVPGTSKPLDKPSVIRLYLWWRDLNASVGGYLANLAGLGVDGLTGDAFNQALVAELSIVSITRQAGERRYDTVITAQERAFKRLAERRVAADESLDDFKKPFDRVKELARRVGITIVPADAAKPPDYGFSEDGSLPAPAADAPGTDDVTWKKGEQYSQLVTNVGAMAARHLAKYGRGMLLIRNGTLHVGKRPIPLDEKKPNEPAKPIALSFRNGLVSSSRAAPAAAPQADGSKSGGGGGADAVPTDVAAVTAGVGPKPGDQWTLTLKGRPDLKPGHVVTFHPPPEETTTDLTKTLLGVGTAVAGSLAASVVMDEDATGTPVTLYVKAVQHRLARSVGFVTTVTGDALAEQFTQDNAWDKDPPANASDNSANNGRTQGSTGSSTGDAAAAVRTQIEAAVGRIRQPEVGEVRAVNPTGTGPTEPPAQTETVWRGLVASDARTNEVRRLAIERSKPEEVNGVAYASPFAWGKCGLVLPRYPGSRVVLVHRGGKADDPVDVGAVWESGHGPESQAGDWWLILPVGASQPSSLTKSESAPAEHTKDVTNDLIDANGNRVIEVGELTLRVRRTGLKQAGERPARGQTQDAITIEHADGGASITIDKDGKITIHAKGDLELTSDNGDITLKARNIDAQVTGQMNVH